MTYTIITTAPASDGSALLLATIPDGKFTAVEAAAERAITEVCDPTRPGERPEWTYQPGLTLTNDEPDDESQIAWSGHGQGWLMDETGRTFQFAVKT